MDRPTLTIRIRMYRVFLTSSEQLTAGLDVLPRKVQHIYGCPITPGSC
jgi:hypothetical protein